MIVIPKKKIVFLERPRTASRSMHQFLLQHCGGKVVDPQAAHYVKMPKKYEGFKVLCGMRNPYSRVYSRFTHSAIMLARAKRPAMGFKRFVLEGRGEQLSDFLALAGVARVDEMIMFEAMPRSFFRALRRLGLTVKGHKELLRKGLSTGKKWREFYNQRRADLVWEAAREDFEDYGYSRDSWKPEK